MKNLVFILLFFIFSLISLKSEAQIQEHGYADSVQIVEIKIAYLLYNLEKKIKTCDEYISQEHGYDNLSLSALQPMLEEIEAVASKLRLAGGKHLFFLKKLRQERDAIFLRSLDEKPDETIYKPQIRRPKVYN